MRKMLIRLGVALALLAALPAAAQETTDDTRTRLSATLEAFAAQDSFAVEVESSNIQQVTVENNTTETRRLLTVSGQAQGGDSLTLLTLKQTGVVDGAEAGRLDVQAERRIVGGVTYLHFRELTLNAEDASVADQALSALALLDEWFIPEPAPMMSDISEGGMSVSEFGLRRFIAELAEQSLRPLVTGYALTDATVKTLSEGEAETVDDRAARVFEVTYNATGLYAAYTEEWNRDFFLNNPPPPLQIVRFLASDRLVISARFWLDAEDDSLLQVEQRFRSAVEPGMLGDARASTQSETVARARFRPLAEPLVVEAPEVTPSG